MSTSTNPQAAKPTNPQILSLWLIACSQLTTPKLNDDAALKSVAGVDVGDGDVRQARDFLVAQMPIMNAGQVFKNMILALGYTPPACPPGEQLQALSALPPK